MQIPTEGLGTSENWAAVDGICYHDRVSNAHMHTCTRTPHTDMSWEMLESSAILNYSTVIFIVKAFTVLSFIYIDMKDFVNQSQTSACYKSAYLYGLKSGFKSLERIYSIYFLIPYVVIIFKRYYFYIWNLKKIRVIYTVLYKMYHTFDRKRKF